MVERRFDEDDHTKRLVAIVVVVALIIGTPSCCFYVLMSLAISMIIWLGDFIDCLVSHEQEYLNQLFPFLSHKSVPPSSTFSPTQISSQIHHVRERRYQRGSD